MERLSIVQAERLELSHLAALDPKSSVSTNSTTPAFPLKTGCKYKAKFQFKNASPLKNPFSNFETDKNFYEQHYIIHKRK